MGKINQRISLQQSVVPWTLLACKAIFSERKLFVDVLSLDNGGAFYLTKGWEKEMKRELSVWKLLPNDSHHPPIEQLLVSKYLFSGTLEKVRTLQRTITIVLIVDDVKVRLGSCFVLLQPFLKVECWLPNANPCLLPRLSQLLESIDP